MPLPIDNQKWPDPALADLLPMFRRWSAWYSGDPDQLTEAYGATPVLQQLNRPAQFSGGIRGVVGRILWGNPIPPGTDDDRVHVPLASDLCSATAELCYSNPPEFTTTKPATVDRLGQYVEDGLFTSMAGGVELGAAHGGRYVQAVFPKDGARCRVEQIAYDGAWPVFRRGQLIAVAFWWVLRATTTGNQVWRHFESHELENGNGIIRHALYLGTLDKIGTRQDLSAHPDTSGLIEPGGPIDQDGVADTGPGLDVVHIPGRTPQRLWRLGQPIGQHLGRSVFQGVEGPLSKLDDAYTSWSRDVDLGRSRLIIADWLLDTGKPGMGASFDLDRRLITQLAMPKAFDGQQIDPIRQIQFSIRVAEHRETCQEWTEVILRSSSFSAQTFGEDEEGNAQTATGVLSKDSRSMRTRRHVLAGEQPGLQTILRKMLQMDQDAGTGPVADPELRVVFPDGDQPTEIELAGVLQALRAAEAASDLTIVRRLHPEWSEQEVANEVAAIRAGAAARANLDATTTTELIV